MNRLLLSLCMSCLMAVALLFTGGWLTAKELVTDSLGRKVEKPRYGGTISIILARGKALDYFDPVISANGGWVGSLNYDKPITADWRKGPTGTGEFPFLTGYVPLKYRTGHLVESWEIKNSQTVILHMRKGVHFHNKPPVNGREMTAHDLEFSIRRSATTPKSGLYLSEKVLNEWVADERKKNPQKINAWLAKLKKLDVPLGKGYTIVLDKWTAKHELYEPNSLIMDVFSQFYVYAEECIEAFGDLKDWRNTCGTGAWIVEEVVPGSAATWRRNPNYWKSDPFHPQNKLPYADKLRGLIIPDPATAMTALRTYQIDVAGVAWDKAGTMKKTNPELLYRKYSPTMSTVMFMRTEKKPFNDVRVRQALSLGLDQIAITRDYFEGNAFTLTWPCQPGNVECYTPLDSLPQATRELFEYHPEKAKKLLAQAGYPKGFKAESAMHSNDRVRIELCLITKEYWTTIGVDLNCKLYDPAIRAKMQRSRTYPSIAMSGWGNSSPSSVLAAAHGGIPGIIWNFSGVVDPTAEEVYTKWKQTLDLEEASKMLKAEYLREMPLVWEIPLPGATGFGFWGPWLKNFSGELSMGPTNEMGNSEKYRHVWVDQELKAKYAGQK
jgi:peptide/nickel transport system substrate-binding protein